MPEPTQPADGGDPTRRRFLTYSSTAAMAGGLASGYGCLAVMGGRFLYPTDSHDKGWMFVAPAREFEVGEARPFTTPSGAQVVIARQGEGEEKDSFIALSSVCPHLGCQVHWEAVGERFFCPCHNGAFDKSGRPTEGPVAKANQSLTRFPVKIEKGLLYLFGPLRSLGVAALESEQPSSKKG